MREVGLEREGGWEEKKGESLRLLRERERMTGKEIERKIAGQKRMRERETKGEGERESLVS